MEPTLAAIYDTLRKGDRESAEAKCRDLLAQVPDYAPAHHALGLCRCAAGAYEDAIEHLARAWHLDPADAAWARDLAIVHVRLERWGDALQVLEPLVATLDAEGLAVYLAAAVEIGAAARAVARVEALSAPPTFDGNPGALIEYGRALRAAGRPQEAVAALSTALRAGPDEPRALEAIALACEDLGEGDRALAHWTALARRRPQSAYARLRLAMACSARGRCEQAQEARREAVRLGLRRAQDYSSALYLMLFDRDSTAEAQRLAYEAAFAGASPPAPSSGRGRRIAPTPSRRLRIGYLSGEFRTTPAYYFLTPFLRHHDRRAVEIVLYSSSPIRDACTRDYQRLCDQWRDVADLSDDDLRTLIVRDEPDVLIDLSGHFPDNRLEVFARRPARAQATFPNYPATTGCPAIDYLFTDQWTSPVGSEEEYSERVHRLASGYLAYAPPAESPEVSPPPILESGGATFGLFQQLSKINGDMWDAIAGTLRAVPRSRLLLHNADPELDRPGSATTHFLHRQLAARELDPSRLRLAGPRPLVEHLALVGSVDIALDTRPYNGQTTTCECLWMGVPVVALRGPTHVGRVTAGLLARAGLDDLVAGTAEAYVEAACRLASDADALVRYRGTLRHLMAACGLTDGVALARAMEAAYRAWAG